MNKRMRRLEKTKKHQVSMMDFLNKVRESAKKHGHEDYVQVRCEITYSHYTGNSRKQFECYTASTGKIFSGKSPNECLEKLEEHCSTPKQSQVADAVVDFGDLSF